VVKLIPEAEFLAANPPTVTIKVVVPADAKFAEFQFNGQMFELVLNLTDTVQTVKEKLRPQLNNMPDKKMKLNFAGGSFLNKDDKNMAFYNIKSGQHLLVGVKERAGKKKK